MSFKIHILAFLLASASLLAAQSLSPQLNAPRHGDAPQYVRVPYAVDGGSGEGCVWQISAAEGETFPVSFAVRGDTAERIEPGIAHTGVCRGDTLAETAFSGRLSSGTFANGGILPLRMSFGDSIHSKYSGAADYCGRLAIDLDGETYTHADASGSIVADGDTVADVLRVRVHKAWSSRTAPGSGPVTERASEDTYLYYAPGYRYPVMVSRRTTTEGSGQNAHTLLCLPQWQAADLAADPENEAVRERLAARDARRPENDVTGATVSVTSAEFRPDGSVSVSYSLQSAGEVTVTVCDVYGSPIGSVSYRRDPGEHTDIVSAGAAPQGSAAVVGVSVGDFNTSIKITR